MNAVEIEEAISALAERPFEAREFPFAFLRAFGNKETTIKRLRSGASNSSNLGGVLQRSNIHVKVCPEGEAAATLAALKASPATARAKAKFVLATDGREFHAEDLNSGDVVVCDYPDFPEHFGFFLPLAGITTVKQIRESAFDIKATGRLNRLFEFPKAVAAPLAGDPLIGGQPSGRKRDTIIVPAQKDGFEETFLGEDCWYAIRIAGGMLDKIKYIAAYQTQPVSAITHYAPVSRIEPYGEGGKYKVVFSESAKPIGPIPYGDAHPGAMQSPRYTSFARLQKAHTLTDVPGKT